LLVFIIMKTLRIFPYALALGLVVATGCSSGSSGPDASLRVENRSDFAIVEIRVTSVGSSTWGPNLIEGDVLAPGESLTLGVDCGFYDALLIDQDGVDCQLHNVDLCLNNADWIIHNDTCVSFGAARAAREAAKAGSATAPSTPAPDANQ
jgi:hypothetical protein